MAPPPGKPAPPPPPAVQAPTPVASGQDVNVANALFGEINKAGMNIAAGTCTFIVKFVSVSCNL